MPYQANHLYESWRYCMKKTIYLTISMCILIILLPQTTKAEGVAYEVKAILPKTQQNPQVSYFDLQLKPAERKEIAIEFSNKTDKAITLNSDVTTATTNNNGVIDYSLTRANEEQKLKIKMAEIVTGPDKIALTAHEKKTVNYQIKMPQEAFEGVLLGGFYITKAAETTTKAKPSLKNEISYVIGLQLSNTEKRIAPKLALQTVEITEQNKRTVITADLRNSAAALISGLTIEARVTKKGDKQAIYTSKKSELGMAPNSNFLLSLDLEQQKLSQGDYAITLKANDKNNNKWLLTKTFNVKETLTVPTEKINSSNRPFTWVIIVSAIAITSIGILLHFYRRKKKEN